MFPPPGLVTMPGCDVGSESPVKAGEFELKVTFPSFSTSSVLRWIEGFCVPDPQFAAGTVFSLYYDSPGWKHVREKVNSDYLKSKVRVRWYGDLLTGRASGPSFVEVKRKVGTRRLKKRIDTGLPASWFEKVSLVDSRLHRLPELARSAGFLEPELLLPAFEIRYSRRRFVDSISGARLCVDYDISAPRVNWQMLPRSNSVRLKKCVFELKGELLELPRHFYYLTNLGGRKESFSKYLSCYRQITNTED